MPAFNLLSSSPFSALENGDGQWVGPFCIFLSAMLSELPYAAQAARMKTNW